MKFVGTSVFHKAQGQIKWEIFWQFPADSKCFFVGYR